MSAVIDNGLGGITIPPEAGGGGRDLAELTRERLSRVVCGYFGQFSEAGLMGLIEIAGLAGDLEATCERHIGESAQCRGKKG